MTKKFPLALILLLLNSCAQQKRGGLLELSPEKRQATSALKATFLGNTTLHITDGETDLLVDGFLTQLGTATALTKGIVKIKSEWGFDEKTGESNEHGIKPQLDQAGITKVDAVLVAHAHADHALDAPTISIRMGAKVMGSTSYGFVHQGAQAPMSKLLKVTDPDVVTRHQFGKFTVSFIPSEHIPARLRSQRKIEGFIHEPIVPPASFNDYKCGHIYAIHISHPDGSCAITTSAGAIEGQWKGLKADVLFIGIGLLGHESEKYRQAYWSNVVKPLEPKTVVPVHWNNFFARTSLESRILQPTPIVDCVERSMKSLIRYNKSLSSTNTVVLGRYDEINIDRSETRLSK